MAKVAIIGAGSVEFTRNILADLSSYRELDGQLHVALHDIDADRLGYAQRAAESIIARQGAGHTVSAHIDRREAFEGADFLINEIQVGGVASTYLDFDIPRTYGVRQTIGDTIGIGGIMRGLRTIPVMIEMANEMATLCPDGLLLNYTNPMAMVPWGIYAGSEWPAERTIGVCHSVRDTHEFLAETVGIPEGDIRYVTAGFNHQCFVYTFENRHTGEDLYPALRARIDADPEGLGRRVRVEIFKQFGYFPTESSEHSSEYVPWFIHLDSQVEHFRVEIDEYLRRSEENIADWKDMKERLDAGQELDIDLNDELASQIVRAVETGVARDIYANVRNDELIDGLPADACVEVPSIADKNGVTPTRVGTLPPQTLALNRTFLNVVELTVSAVLEGRRDHVYQAALLDPNTAAHLTTAQTHAMVDELLAAHGDKIPEPIRRG
ncbi:MAG: alpha-galactosidase [Actinomycetota bacterium]|nr:alpha-galactosidase [Actinomycetota bacterium]